MAKAVDLGVPLPLKSSYVNNSYATHKCGKGRPGGPLGFRIPDNNIRRLIVIMPGRSQTDCSSHNVRE